MLETMVCQEQMLGRRVMGKKWESGEKDSQGEMKMFGKTWVCTCKYVIDGHCCNFARHQPEPLSTLK